MSVYVGIDVHRKRSQVAVIDQDGKVLANRNVNNGVSRSCRDRRPAVGHPRGFRGRVRLGMAGGTAGGLRLRAAPGPPAAVQGHRVGAAEERQGRRRDFGAAAARGPAAGGVDRAARQLRALLRHRAQLVRLRTLLQNRIHAVLADHGCDRPAGCWSGPGREWLASLELPAVSAEVMNDALALIDALESVTGRLDLEVRQHARSDPRVKILTRLPGVGPFTALVLPAEIGDITRFASARKLASWAGLTPTVRGSDRTVRHGHISKMVCAGGMVPLCRPEVCDGGGWRIGFASGSADVRLCRYRDGRELAWPDLSCGPGEPARVAAPVPRRAGRGVRGRGVHRVALRGGGTAAGRDHSAPGRARRDGRPAGP